MVVICLVSLFNLCGHGPSSLIAVPVPHREVSVTNSLGGSLRRVHIAQKCFQRVTFRMANLV